MCGLPADHTIPPQEETGAGRERSDIAVRIALLNRVVPEGPNQTE